MAASQRPPVIVHKSGSPYDGQQGQIAGVYYDRLHLGYQPGVVTIDEYCVRMRDGTEQTFLTPELDLSAYQAAEQREARHAGDMRLAEEARQNALMPTLYLFDVDGTLVSSPSGKSFRKTANDWALLPGRLDKIQALRDTGATIALVSNQGGVAFGYFTEDEMQLELDVLQALIGAEAVYVCYQHPYGSIDAYRAENEDRMPGPGMLLEAMRDFGVQPSAVVMIGQRPEDRHAAAAASVTFIEADIFFAAPVQ